MTCLDFAPSLFVLQSLWFRKHSPTSSGETSYHLEVLSPYSTTSNDPTNDLITHTSHNTAFFRRIVFLLSQILTPGNALPENDHKFGSSLIVIHTQKSPKQASFPTFQSMMYLNEYFVRLASDTGANKFYVITDRAVCQGIEIRPTAPIPKKWVSAEKTKFSSFEYDTMPSLPERQVSGGNCNTPTPSYTGRCVIEESRSMRQQIQETVHTVLKSKNKNTAPRRKLRRRSSCDDSLAFLAGDHHEIAETPTRRSRPRSMSMDSCSLFPVDISPISLVRKEARWKN